MKEWIKLESTFMMDSRIQLMIQEEGFAALGLYIVMRTSIEATNSSGLTLPQVLASCQPYVRKKKLMSVIEDYDLFSVSDMDVVTFKPLVCVPAVVPAVAPAVACAGGLISEKKEKEKENNNNNNNEPRFRKPTIPEIAEYCQQRNNGIDANHFFDYYESKGWMIGKGKMKDWHAAVRTWERTNREIVRRTTRTIHETTEEYSDESQVCYNCQPIPADAPPRPSPTAQWDFATDSWSEFY